MSIGWRGASSRRHFLSEAGAGAGAWIALGAAPPARAAEPDADEALWREAEAIVERIAEPSFPARDFVVTTFGAVGDGRANCTAAIRTAIRACSNAGGGRSGAARAVPDRRPAPVAERQPAPRRWRHAAVPDHTRRLSAGRSTRYGGNDLFNYAPLIYAYNQRNIAITGAGTLDGQASNIHWWPWSGLRSSAGGRGNPPCGPMSTACAWRPKPGCRSRAASSARGTISGPASSSPWLHPCPGRGRHH